MRVFGSLNNRIMEGAPSPVPEIGMGATVLMHSDRHAATVVEINAEKTRVVIQEDIATRTDNNGMSGPQIYTYKPNRQSPRAVYTKRKSGEWVKEGHSLKRGERIRLGVRDHHYDYEF